MPSANRIPTINVPITDPPNTGLPSRAWFRFFQNLNTVVSGVYTPTLLNATNVLSYDVNACQYFQVYDVVTVSGTLRIQANSSGAVQFMFTLPVASNFTLETQAAGTFATTTSGTNIAGGIVATTPFQQPLLFFKFTAPDAVSRNYSFTATYRIV
jgi:hypothetical protein